MPMTNMKQPPPKMETKATCDPCIGSREEYPYGLRIHLDTPQLEQLGLDKLPDVGGDITFMCKARVTDVHESASEREKEQRRSVSLQITDIDLTPAKPKKATEDVFYKGSDEK